MTSLLKLWNVDWQEPTKLKPEGSQTSAGLSSMNPHTPIAHPPTYHGGFWEHQHRNNSKATSVRVVFYGPTSGNVLFLSILICLTRGPSADSFLLPVAYADTTWVYFVRIHSFCSTSSADSFWPLLQFEGREEDLWVIPLKPLVFCWKVFQDYTTTCVKVYLKFSI